MQYQSQGITSGASRDQQLLHVQLQNQVPSQASFNNDLAYPNPYPQAPPHLVAQIMGTTTRDKASHFNIFSNSFDETEALQLEMRPQRNCKSSTRMLNQTHNGGRQRQSGNGQSRVIQQQVAIPLLQNLGGNNSFVAKVNNSGSLNRTTESNAVQKKSKSGQSVKTAI